MGKKYKADTKVHAMDMGESLDGDSLLTCLMRQRMIFHLVYALVVFHELLYFYLDFI